MDPDYNVDGGAEPVLVPKSYLTRTLLGYMKFGEYACAMRLALYFNWMEGGVLSTCTDLLMRTQLCFMIARHAKNFIIEDHVVDDDNMREFLQSIVNNTQLSIGYLTLAKEIKVMEPKMLEDIYKACLLYGRTRSGTSVASARENLVATFVFVNASFGQDKLMTAP